ncbi:MAG: DUF3142 domain-containing protein, partial [Dokdonella sp.]
AQMHPREGLVVARVDLKLLANDQRPVIAVLRLDGELAALEPKSITALVARIVEQWRAADVNLVGIEIDYDCATSRLPDYARVLRELRGEFANELILSITVLPTWMDSSALPSVLRNVDQAVLQVHSVSSPDRGLFDATKARQWIARFDTLSPIPYWAALPSYGGALVFDREGKVQVESERVLPIAGTRTELQIDPRGMADFLRMLQREKPTHLLGIVWFRLPLSDDTRGWSMATLAAVIEGRTLVSAIDLRLQRNGPAHDLVVGNTGSLDSEMPEQITIRPADCEAADALAGYSLQREPSRLVFHRTENATLRAGSERVIAWLRCRNADAEVLHAEP